MQTDMLVALAIASAVLLSPSVFVHGASYDLDILFTREVRGAAYPVNKWNTQCTAAAVNQTPCKCFGGAARRNAVLHEAGEDAIRLDLGGYASGSGLFFPALHGKASAEFLADGDYSAMGLTYRDFAAGVNSSDPTGGAHLAAYIDRVRALNPSIPPAVVTNIDLSNDTHLVASEATRANPNPVGHVAPWALIPFGHNRTLAFLSMVDPQHLHPTSPHYASKVFSYERALQSALAGLRRLEGGPPDVIVAAISSIPLNGAPNGFADLHHRHGTSDTAEAATRELRAIVHETIGVDVFLMGLLNDLPLPPVMKNWAGDDVLVYQVASGGSHGKRVERIHAEFDSQHSRLVGGDTTTDSVELDCGIARDTDGEAKLAHYHDVMESILGKTRGYLQHELSFNVRSAPRPGGHAWGHCARLGTDHDVETCGCRVSECPQGSFAADALQVVASAQIGLVNGGSLRSSLPQGAVTEADIVQMLPFLNDIVRVQVSGAVLRSVLLNSISLLGDASAMSDPNGRFMQASSTLKYEWYFEDGRPTLGAVSVRPSDDADFEPLASEQSYTLAVTSYIAGGGDGYSMLTAVPQTPIGKTQAELTAEYLRLLGAARPGVPMPTEGRIVQKPTVVLLHVGILCAAPSHGNVTDRLAEREICDHVHHTIEMLNDKADGLYDELLPNAVIVAHEAYVGCNEGLAHSALSGLRAALPSMKAVIGPSCSNDVAAIAHKASEGAGEATVISGASTMQSLSNESEYPMLARTVTPDGHTATAHRTLMELYSWKRVGVLHSDSAWATEVSQLFVDGMQAASDEAVVLNEGDTEFSLSEAQSDGFDAGMLLKRLQKLDTRDRKSVV